ncbi:MULTISPECIES: hypothetical protein [unclassified Amycolatopsis]|nr:hypothetical protein [Amycolatopsis sp. DSM 110486]
MPTREAVPVAIQAATRSWGQAFSSMFVVSNSLPLRRFAAPLRL